MPDVDLKPYAEEVEANLPNEFPLMAEAQRRQDFYEFRAALHEQDFKRPSESSFDYQGRPHPACALTRQAIDVLCEHLYLPGPSRTWDDEAGDEILQMVYTDNLINNLMHEADVLSSLNACCAIQIDAGTGELANKPITYRLWGREQFAVWTDPDDQRIPIVCVTKDKYDEQTRFRLWSDEEVWTFLTAKLGVDQTSGGRVAYQVRKEKHEYGCLPFTFTHYKLPTRDFYGTGIGEFAVKSELSIDEILFTLAECLLKYLPPVPVAEGMPDEWKPMQEPGRWIRVPLAGPTPGDSGGFERGPYARLYYLQAAVAVEEAWVHIEKYIDQCCDAMRIPRQTLKMEQASVASGIALIVDMEPLVRRAKNRRGAWAHYEEDLARRTLTAIGSHYHRQQYVNSAEKGKLTCTWAQSVLSVRTPDMLEMLNEEVTTGYKSKLMAIEEWYDVDRTRALRICEQMKEDDDELMKLNPSMVVPMMPVPMNGQANGQMNGEPQPGSQGNEPAAYPPEAP